MLPISTDVIELEITQNRPDCLGIYGVAREVHAATGAPLRAAAVDRGSRGPPATSTGSEITVEVPRPLPAVHRACVRGRDRSDPSPPWLKARLMAAGQRPISNVVDITNYVMLLTGQPLHAFDLDRVAGRQLTDPAGAHRGRRSTRSTARRGRSTTEMVLIADDDGPTSIAGVMGGAALRGAR